MITILQVPTLVDNYSYIVHRSDSKRALVIDASEAAPISEALRQRDLHLELIITTHHHHDHVGGNEELAKEYSAAVWSSLYDLTRVPMASRGLTDGERFHFDEIGFEALMIPGHTSGQIAVFIESVPAVFVGDTLFAMGCGRIYEGSFEELHASLNKIAALPKETKLYFGHEYTQRNSKFALQVEPENESLIRKRLDSKITIPTLEQELEVNPFLRARNLERFTRLRKLRNQF